MLDIMIICKRLLFLNVSSVLPPLGLAYVSELIFATLLIHSHVSICLSCSLHILGGQSAHLPDTVLTSDTSEEMSTFPAWGLTLPAGKDTQGTCTSKTKTINYYYGQSIPANFFTRRRFWGITDEEQCSFQWFTSSRVLLLGHMGHVSLYFNCCY